MARAGFIARKACARSRSLLHCLALRFCFCTACTGMPAWRWFNFLSQNKIKKRKGSWPYLLTG